MSDPFSRAAVGGAYDAVADDYVERFGDDLARLPLDREMLDAALDAAPAGEGAVVEVGCGPASAAGHLAGRAGRLVGVDLSAAMLVHAARRVPRLQPVQGDLRALPLRDGAARLAIALYCVQHLERSRLGDVWAELARVLRPGGALLVATHLGEGEVTIEGFLGHEVAPVAGTFHSRDEIVAGLGAAGLSVAHERRRHGLAHEAPTERLYVLATAPS